MRSHTKIFLFAYLLYWIYDNQKRPKICNVNPLYLIFGEVNGYFEEINGNTYSTLVPTNESKVKYKKHGELWSEIIDLIRSITKKSDDYDENYIKIKFDSDDNLPLNETIEIPIVTIVVRAVFHEYNIYYPQIFLNEHLYKIQK